MEELGSHQTAMGPHQADAILHQAESGGSQHNNPFVNLQHRGDYEGNAYTTLLVEPSLEGRVMFPMQGMIETCNMRLIN